MALPEADPDLRRWFIGWLERFASYVREVDFAAARPLWDPDVIVFGTYQDVVQGREAAIARQWRNVWPQTADFRFDLGQTRVLAATGGDVAVVIAPWSSTGFSKDGTPFPRPGRATLVFAERGSGWRVVHSHMSLERGVPQESFAGRPVKSD